MINVIDGKGNLYETEITHADPQNCTARIINKKQIAAPKPYRLHIAISPTKNIDRIEWMVEKCTELGVDEFSFIICKRTEKTGIKTERLKKITESAVKQSIQTILPVINEALSFKDFVSKQSGASSKHIAHCIEEEKAGLNAILQNPSSIVLIGPEGDFTEDEIKLALQNNFKALSLGNSRLRTETAGLYVAAAYKAFKG